MNTGFSCSECTCILWTAGSVAVQTNGSVNQDLQGESALLGEILTGKRFALIEKSLEAARELTFSPGGY